MTWWTAMSFVFFSWLIWPVWVPFGIYLLEPPASRRLPLLGFALAGLQQSAASTDTPVVK